MQIIAVTSSLLYIGESFLRPSAHLHNTFCGFLACRRIRRGYWRGTGDLGLLLDAGEDVCAVYEWVDTLLEN
jgi:hypothetical protein